MRTNYVEVVTPPKDNLLTTLPLVKSFLNIKQDDLTQDPMLNFLLHAYSDFAETYCGRKFARQEVIEHAAGDGTPTMLLSVTPIISITSVFLDEGEITDCTVEDPELGSIIRGGTNWASTDFSWGLLNPAPSGYAKKAYAIRYIGGYNLPGWTATAPGPTPARTLPYDLERAMIEMMRSAYKQIGTGADPAMTTYKIGETMASWKRDADSYGGDMAALGIPPSAMGILQHYRRAY